MSAIYALFVLLAIRCPPYISCANVSVTAVTLQTLDAWLYKTTSVV